MLKTKQREVTLFALFLSFISLSAISCGGRASKKKVECTVIKMINAIDTKGRKNIKFTKH